MVAPIYKDGTMIVRVTSDGPDGLTQWGEGDDLYLQISVFRGMMDVVRKP